ncbi:bifunctional UDP-N-acetylglucosamine diphosphorylase/glucosamine-1-phosphate N-acetyltransferase GlmU [Paenibacillus sp. J2TS4]|uniref:bifunctional UDP-N-acetylglucosamine diphosphorylase/glucosamine-1-phosphate N-acetyltransferase GlmU n=1 Tax=Paenibacillus sp. J2TS4 TaxID=2807194 RepID=UPI001B17F4A1|nr:bifunctional UDP-N-acetylglucosamine diphosphorylase/glucosamine-1-phosphate N-acetyltransferase GlmU [Paenibacillus sp. J2TS4]GIP36332.1 bifunctional protein GlmU [Paenibacillus sp. J2TS4]
MQINSIILAAGLGKRMKSKLYKMLHPVCGKPMVGHVLDLLDGIETNRKVAIVGNGADEIKAYLGDRAEYVFQAEQLGTGHAVLQAKPLLEHEQGMTIVICGDTPLVKEETLKEMIRLHLEQQAAATILTATMADPSGYGRITRDDQGAVAGIVEQKDCSEAQLLIQEINAGTYLFDNQKLFQALNQVTNNNAQKEYYLTDVIGILKAEGETVMGYNTSDPAEAVGINDRIGLAEAEKLMRERILRHHMLNGVTILDPEQTYIGSDVEIGQDTVLLPGTVLKGTTKIGEDCVIGPYSEIEHSILGEGVTVRQSVLQEAEVGNHSHVGPFAYLRPGAKLGEEVKVGDFVEIKNATLGDQTKVSHLSYVGDAVIGKNVNIGCGAITVNYDGLKKHLTEVEDEAFIGSNVNLIAPVKVGKGAYVVAGSTITLPVEEGDLAIARERQVNKSGYADKLRSRIQARNSK